MRNVRSPRTIRGATEHLHVFATNSDIVTIHYTVTQYTAYSCTMRHDTTTGLTVLVPRGTLPGCRIREDSYREVLTYMTTGIIVFVPVGTCIIVFVLEP